MTEQDAVKKLKRLAKAKHCAVREASESSVRGYSHFDEAFVIGRKADTVTFFAFCESPVDPPADVLMAFRHLRRVYVTPDPRRSTEVNSLDWLRCIRTVTTLKLFNWDGEDLPENWDGEKLVDTLYLETISGKVPLAVRRMKSLRQLGLYSPNMIVLPQWLTQLNRLDRIFLKNCIVRDIPENLWRYGPPIVLDNVRKDRGIFLYGSTLRMVDLSLYRGPDKAIERHYRKIGSEKKGDELQAWSECMVIFLGDGAVGKSSLIERLIERKEFKEGASSPTNGVKMQTWSTQVPIKSNDGKRTEFKPFNLRMMDFGGQEIMHAIHRCFLTENTVYVVVCESRMDTNIDNDAVRWLETVKTFAPLSPVILALNKADLNENVSLNEKDLKRRYPNLKGILKTTARSEKEYSKAANCKYCLEKLEDAIKKEALSCDSSNQAGADWIAVKRDLENMSRHDPKQSADDGEASREKWDEAGREPRTSSTEHTVKQSTYRGYITDKEYRDICVRHHVTEEEDQRAMLDWFRDLGVVYTYDKTPNGEIKDNLKDVLVLDPEWLSNGIYRIILRAPENRFLTNRQIRDTLDTIYHGDLSELQYTDRTVDGTLFSEPKYILHVMQTFKLAYPIDSEETMGEDNDERVMIPSRFSKNPPEKAEKFPETDSLHLYWKGKYLPNNVIHRLMISRFHELDSDCMWRTGGRFRLVKDNGVEDAQAMFSLNEEGLDLYVSAGAISDDRNRQTARKYLSELRLALYAILNDMNLQPKEYVCTRLREKNNREVRFPLCKVLQAIGTVPLSDEVSLENITVQADYSVSSPTDADQESSEYVSAMRMLEDVYMNSRELVLDYRTRRSLRRESPPPETESDRKKGLFNWSKGKKEDSEDDKSTILRFLRDALMTFRFSRLIFGYAAFAFLLLVLIIILLMM